MQGLDGFAPNGVVQPKPTPNPPFIRRLTIYDDEAEPTEAKIQRLIMENPVIIFYGGSSSSSGSYMCHVMKKLLSTLGVYPAVIELGDGEIESLLRAGAGTAAPTVFIAGDCVGGLESLVALHLGGELVPRLVGIGAL